MENVRICDENDMAAISGWESTAIENHSGLVDNFRDFKADPRSISDSLLPVRPVAKQRHLVLATGDRANFDIYLLNDTDAPVTGTLTFTLDSIDMPSTWIKTFPAPSFVKDRLSYLLKENVETPALTRAGTYRTHLSLNDNRATTHLCNLLVVDPAPIGMRPLRIGIADAVLPVEDCLKALLGTTSRGSIRITTTTSSSARAA